MISRFSSVFLILGLLLVVRAHEHHEESTGPYEMNFRNEEELDGRIKIHIALQILSWGLIFPSGMVLAIARGRWSKFHAPLQIIGIIISTLGTWFGHHHAGRSFHQTAHASFSSYLFKYLVLQTICGIILKVCFFKNDKVKRARSVVKGIHGFVGKTFPVVGWTQMIFGGITSLGFCFGEHTTQCAAHFIMGSVFIGYGIMLTIMIYFGTTFLTRRKCSQEFIDSIVLTVIGIINTFTEHNFLQAGNGSWSHKDMQHVSLGVLWWAGGSLGIVLSRNNKRSLIPGVIISMTGYAMSAHGQSLEFSTTIHKIFGYALMGAGLARVIEISFLLKDSPSEEGNIKSFQHATPFLLTISGLIFLSSTEEQMQWISNAGMDSATYANILFSASFTIYAFAMILIQLSLFCSTSKILNDEENESTPRNWFAIPRFPGFGNRLSSTREGDGNYQSVALDNLEGERGSTLSEETVFDIGDEDDEKEER